MNCSYFTLSIILFLSALTTNSFAQYQFETIKEIAAAQGYSITPLAGDYDGDGDIDILGTGSYIKDAVASGATVLLRNDGGEFVVVDIQLPSFYFGGMYQWADLDGDNDLDIIAGGCTYYCYNTKAMSIYRNDGGDQFTLITQQTNLIGGTVFSLADYNNDGLIDIEIATQSDNDGSVIGHAFYKNTGNFIFQKTFELPVTAGEGAWGDLNKDGLKDVVLLDHAYKNLGDGTFQAFSSPDAMQQHIRHFIFDADNDGDQDVITNNGIMMKNDGNGVLSFGPVVIPYEYINSLVIADFDGDGNQDMVASGGNSSGAKTELFRSNGDGTFTSESLNDQYNQTYNLAMADMDNDKDPDILISGLYIDGVIVLENGLATALSKPSAPANLQTSANASTIGFSWDAATDNEQSSLAYNLYLLYGDNFQIAPCADLATGVGFIPGRANALSALQWQITTSTLPEGYFRWSVQSVDDEMNASLFATPQEFTLYKNNPANAPTGLTPIAVADHSISLAWTDNATDETSFTIERSSQDGNTGFEEINDVTSNTVSYVDNTVLSRTVYYYRIRLDGSAAVAYSNVIRIMTAPTITITPVNVAAVSLNSASAKISWEYSGTGITGFVIERSPDDKKHFTVVDSTDAATLIYTDQQLESGRTFYYRVFALSGQDVSDYSNILKVSLPLKEFNKITLSSLMYESKYIMGGIAWGDYDNDGYDDLFIGYKAQLFHNKGDGTFEPIPLTGITASSANDFVAVWGDYDNDGFLDLYAYNNIDKSSLYRGHGDGTFTKIVTVINGDLSQITNATWTDYDMDGDLDLSMTGGRYIYRNDGNDTFVRVDLPGNAASYYSSSVASWGDYDDDGDPDLFLGNNGKDELFMNNSDGTFTPVTDQRVTVDYNYDCCPVATPTALWTDFNNDRKLDLTTFPAGAPIFAYANHANNFDSVFYSFEYNRETWKNLFWTDYDSDGDLDLFAMGQYNLRTDVWENKKGQPFSLLKGGPLYDYVPSDAAFSWNDYDNDGYSDLFQFDGDHGVYKNLSNGNSWIKIRLKGRASNSTGLGAKVFVKSNGQWQRSDVTTHHSFQVQQGFMSLFGLGKATHVDSISIFWPSGYRQYLIDTEVNQVILLDENDAQEKVTQPPSNLTATAEFPSSITLKWADRSEDETGFVIEMAIGDGQFTQAGTVDPNVTTFKIDGLTTGMLYKFRVWASGPSTSRSTNVAVVQIRLFTEVFGGDLTTFESAPDGVSWGDPDGDGDPDLFVGSHSFVPDAVYYNDGGKFIQHNLRSTSNYSRQAQWIDYNNDGYQDLHISVGGGIAASPEYLNNFLYKNDGTGLLVEQTDNNLEKDGNSDYTAAWGDLNKDGFLDMVRAADNGQSTVFLNLGGNMVSQQQSDVNFRPSGMVVLFDIDNDRDLDMISSDYFDRQSLYENVSGQFTPITGAGVFIPGPSFVLEDFDNDGDFDLLGIGEELSLKLYLYDPISKKFTDNSDAFPQLNPVMRVSAGDFDNNGFMDVIVTGQVFGSNTNRIFLNNGNLKFTSLEDPLLDRPMTGTAIADFNKDGQLDLFASTNDGFDGKRYLLQGNKGVNHWLRVKLKGTGLNKFAIGARVRLFTGDTSQVRDIRSGAGGTFSDEQIAHFGLGSRTTVDYIKVEWPSGEDQWISNPPIDTELTVEQADVPGPAAPASPSNLTATFSFPGYIALQWNDNSDKEKSFRIERAIGSNSFEFFKNVPANSTTYTDSTFVNYSNYQLNVKYRVIAHIYITVESDPSNVASVSQITGVEEKAKGLIIYPQPASSKVFIQSDELMRSITIIGALGETLSEISVGSLEVEIPIGHLAPGMYFIQITTDGGTSVKKLLVVSQN